MPGSHLSLDEAIAFYLLVVDKLNDLLDALSCTERRIGLDQRRNGLSVVPSEPETTAETTKLSGSVEQNPLTVAAAPVQSTPSNGTAKKSTNPAIRILIDTYRDETKALTGFYPTIEGVKAAQAAARIAAGRPIEEAVALVKDWVHRPPKWNREHPGTLGLEFMPKTIPDILRRWAEDRGWKGLGK